MWKAFVIMIPTLAAALVAISRIMDARHHPFDVISGSALGMTVAWLAYRQYFPPISEPWKKGRAYPIRSWASGPRIPRSGERTTRDHVLEPLQRRSTNRDMVDEEQPPRISRQASYHEPVGDPGNNVFRQQLSKSQRMRQNEFGAARGGDPDSSLELQPRNPEGASAFAPLNTKIRRKGVREPTGAHSDGHWSSDTSNHDERTSEEGIELQRRPTRRTTAPVLSKDESDIHPTHRLDVSDFEQDTSYHSRAQSPRAGV